MKQIMFTLISLLLCLGVFSRTEIELTGKWNYLKTEYAHGVVDSTQIEQVFDFKENGICDYYFYGKLNNTYSWKVTDYDGKEYDQQLTFCDSDNNCNTSIAVRVNEDLFYLLACADCGSISQLDETNSSKTYYIRD